MVTAKYVCEKVCALALHPYLLFGGFWERCEAKPDPSLVAGKGLSPGRCGVWTSRLSTFCLQTDVWVETNW